MRKIWFLMIVCSIAFLLFKSPNSVVESMITSSTNAIELLIKLLGIYAIWLGILEIVEQSKLNVILSNLLSPIIKWLFGNVDKQTKNYISLNLSSNMLGLGNACTPMGIKAMQQLDKHHNSTTASHQMIMLLILNATSIQLLPTTVISLRASFNSLEPTNIILPSLIATFVSTLVGVLGVKFLQKLFKGRNKN